MPCCDSEVNNKMPAAAANTAVKIVPTLKISATVGTSSVT